MRASVKTPRPATTCPACGNATSYLTDWEFSGLGKSVFNYVANYYACNTCGLVHVHNIDDLRLARFYARECSYFDSAHFEVTSPANLEKYVAYKNFIVSMGLGRVNVTDIGCGRGGFLAWLKQSGWTAECRGVDVDLKSIPTTILAANSVMFKSGGALDLPFDSETQSLLTYFHVLEHIRDIDRLLDEAFRVLQPDGHLLIEVPDAENYEKLPIGSAFWVSIREHVHHFSACSLAHGLHRHGFSVVQSARRVLPTPEFAYPSLMILGRKASTPTSIPECSAGDIANFVLVSKSALNQQAKEICSLAAGNERITFWGVSAELLSLLPLLDLRQVALCDSSKLKQRSSYKSLAIKDPSEIRPEGILVVAPYLHGDAIEQAALKLGWRHDAIHRLK